MSFADLWNKNYISPSTPHNTCCALNCVPLPQNSFVEDLIPALWNVTIWR